MGSQALVLWVRQPLRNTRDISIQDMDSKIQDMATVAMANQDMERDTARVTIRLARAMAIILVEVVPVLGTGTRDILLKAMATTATMVTDTRKRSAALWWLIP